MNARAHATAIVVSFAVVIAAYGFLAWRVVRTAESLEEVTAPVVAPVDPAPIRALLEDVRLRALVPIAPPPQPTLLGNTNPFPGPREPEVR